MSGRLHIVFSRCPDYVSEEEFDAWYESHLPEILTIPGFVSAQRYRLDPVVESEEAPRGYGFLAVYEVVGDFETLLADMERLNLTTKDSYVEFRKEGSGRRPLPEWWDDVRFLSWNCEPLGVRVEAQ